MLKDIIRLADRLDKAGFKAQALYLDGLIEKMANAGHKDWTPEYLEISFLKRVGRSYALSNNLDLSNKEDLKKIEEWLSDSFKVKLERAQLALVDQH